MFLKFGGITGKVRKIKTVICQKQNKIVNNVILAPLFARLKKYLLEFSLLTPI
jgi:hypothetical protein